jgi:coproporphyrinogen III oxidase
LDDENSNGDPGDDDRDNPLGNAGNHDDPSPPGSNHGEDTPWFAAEVAMVAPATIPMTQFMEMQKAFLASMNQIANLTSWLANGPPATCSQPTKEFKPKDPNTFKGKSWQELETFLFNYKEYFKAWPLILAIEDQ